MITEKTAKKLASLHPRNKPPGCIILGEIAIISSTALILEVPKAEVDVEFEGVSVGDVRQWRYRFVPQDVDPEPAQPLRITWDDHEVIQLLSDNVNTHISAELFDFLEEEFPGLEYRLYPGTRPDGSPHAVGIYRDGKLVGAVAPLVKRDEAEEAGWQEV